MCARHSDLKRLKQKRICSYFTMTIKLHAGKWENNRTYCAALFSTMMYLICHFGIKKTAKNDCPGNSVSHEKRYTHYVQKNEYEM